MSRHSIGAALLFALGAVPASALAEPHPDAERIVAIGGAVTEFVYAFGAGDRLVARDTTSTFPPEAMALPDVGYMRQLSPEGVLSMRPDLILAEEGAGPPEAVALLKSAGIPYEEIPSGASPGGVLAKADAVAEVLGVADGALRAALEADLTRAAKADRAIATPQRVLFVLSAQDDRLLAAGAGTGAEAIITLAGATNAVSGFQGYKPLTDEAVIAAAPDAILMMDRGDGATDPEAQKAQVLAMPAVTATPAGKAGRVIRMNGLYLLGFGPRTGKAALDLHRALYGGA
ncbi:heme/hemin ABC transporter substrate-binding protein [Paracoccus pacificus]|uniref:Hemin ABC transporter substrate-binding protein n=1 Tax=Paracoccus pacificus TaxID=1463598 RepID=A0ABW4R4X2_9RHOB